jgi:hypothetical protein
VPAIEQMVGLGLAGVNWFGFENGQVSPLIQLSKLCNAFQRETVVCVLLWRSILTNVNGCCCSEELMLDCATRATPIVCRMESGVGEMPILRTAIAYDS